MLNLGGLGSVVELRCVDVNDAHGGVSRTHSAIASKKARLTSEAMRVTLGHKKTHQELSPGC